MQELAQRLDLFRRWFVVHAIDKRGVGALERFGRRDIGEDHELFDQAMGDEALGRDHAVDGAVGLEQDLALGKVKIERIARVARAFEGG